MLERGDLERALSLHTRTVIQDNWQVGAGATTTVIPVTLRNPFGHAVDITGQVAADMQGARIEFTNGQNQGASRLVNAALANGQLTLDTTLAHVPAAGDSFVLFQDIHVAVTVASPDNIAQVGGVGQTGADWTTLFLALSSAAAAIGAAAPANALQVSSMPVVAGTVAHGTAVGAGAALFGAVYTASANGSINVTVAIQAAAPASVFNVTLDGANYYTLNNGNALTVAALYAFTIPCKKGDTVDVSMTTATTIGVLEAFFTPTQ